MRDRITRYQPTAADQLDPQINDLTPRELATFVLGVVAARLTSGLRTGVQDEIAERAAARILAGKPDDRDAIECRAHFANQWSRLCLQVDSDRTINAIGRPPVSHE